MATLKTIPLSSTNPSGASRDYPCLLRVFLSVRPKGIVQSRVLTVADNLQVIGSVVSGIAVYVVDMLARVKKPSQRPLHYQPMFKHIPGLVGRRMVRAIDEHIPVLGFSFTRETPVVRATSPGVLAGRINPGRPKRGPSTGQGAVDAGRVDVESLRNVHTTHTGFVERQQFSVRRQLSRVWCQSAHLGAVPRVTARGTELLRRAFALKILTAECASQPHFIASRWGVSS